MPVFAFAFLCLFRTYGNTRAPVLGCLRMANAIANSIRSSTTANTRTLLSRTHTHTHARTVRCKRERERPVSTKLGFIEHLLFYFVDAGNLVRHTHTYTTHAYSTFSVR